MAKKKGRQHDFVRRLAWMRLGFGAAFFLMPRRAVRVWTGDENGPAAHLPARALGAREVALGLGCLVALRRRAPVRGWVEAGVLSDASDAVIAGVLTRGVPPVRRLLGALAPAVAAYRGRQIASSLD